MNFRSIATLITTLIIGTAAFAHDYQAGQIHVDHPYARATMPMQPTAGAYLTIENKGKTADKLIALASPAAKNVELHTMSMAGNVMKKMSDNAMAAAKKLATPPTARQSSRRMRAVDV